MAEIFSMFELVFSAFALPASCVSPLWKKITRKMEIASAAEINRARVEHQEQFRKETENLEFEKNVKIVLAHPELEVSRSLVEKEIEDVYNKIPYLKGMAPFWYEGDTTLPLLTIMLKRGLLPSTDERFDFRTAYLPFIFSDVFHNGSTPADLETYSYFVQLANTMLAQHNRCGMYRLKSDRMELVAPEY